MFELILVALLIFITYQLYLRNKKVEIKNKFYFAEEGYMSSNKLVGVNTDFYFYTVAEFNEVTQIDNYGVEKKLGFSDFIFIYDKVHKKFITARVSIIGTDSYQRVGKIGFYKYLSNDDYWIELNIRLSLSEYDVFASDLKEAVNDFKEKGERFYFLYSINGRQSFSGDGDYKIFFIDSISKIGKYNSYYADKIGVFNDLKSDAVDLDDRQVDIRNEIMERFNKINC